MQLYTRFRSTSFRTLVDCSLSRLTVAASNSYAAPSENHKPAPYPFDLCIHRPLPVPRLSQPFQVNHHVAHSQKTTNLFQNHAQDYLQ